GKVATAGDFLPGLGASRIVTRDDVTNVARPMQRPRWAGVVDTVGGPMLETALASTKMLGVVTVCGLVASPELHTTVYPFILRGISMIGIDSANFPIADRRRIWNLLATEWKLPDLATMAREVTLDGLDVEIEKILAGQQTGRVVVKLP
ncbi:MAG TPA: oxidoreductase, partial [Anaerolineae bacterium]|nr:oxidoreductase [Anaerolineae bacterium]